MKKNTGFTLIELIVVVGILSMLSIVVMSAIKPARRFSETRDARRAEDANQILSAVHQCAIDKKDSPLMPTCLGTVTAGTTYEITSSNVNSGCQTLCTNATSDSSCLQLNSTLDDYFVNLPTDPSGVVTGHTGYSLTLYSNGMTVIEACAAENGSIKASR